MNLIFFMNLAVKSDLMLGLSEKFKITYFITLDGNSNDNLQKKIFEGGIVIR